MDGAGSAHGIEPAVHKHAVVGYACLDLGGNGDKFHADKGELNGLAVGAGCILVRLLDFDGGHGAESNVGGILVYGVADAYGLACAVGASVAA